jgi:quaternary ammonium compound-resistance protein SugE
MTWFILLLAGLFEICWAVGLKYSNGFTDHRWTAFTIITLVLSMSLLAYSLKTLPVGTAYAVWTGIGAVGTAVLGIYLFGESRDIYRLLCILLIVAGITGLKLLGR